MIQLHYIKAHYLQQLYNELIAAGMDPLWPIGEDGDNIYIDVPDDCPQSMIDKIAQTVSNHIPNPPPPPKLPDEILIDDLNAATTLDQVKAALVKRAQAEIQRVKAQ